MLIRVSLLCEGPISTYRNTDDVDGIEWTAVQTLDVENPDSVIVLRPLTRAWLWQQIQGAQASLEFAPARGREIRRIELSAAGPGDVSKRPYATQPLKLAVVVL